MNKVDGSALLDELKNKFKAKTDVEITQKLGQTANKYRGKEVSVRQIAGIIFKAREAAVKDFAAQCIKPIAEFYPLAVIESKGGANLELFDRNINPKYTDGLYQELIKSNGIYIFYDSCGKAIYAGKAAKQTLWKEMVNAFNRDRGENQTIKAVQHPTQNQAYRPTEEKFRQIQKRPVCLCDIAAYFSAYSIVGELIDLMEAFLVRSFANDILNKKMEKFPSLQIHAPRHRYSR